MSSQTTTPIAGRYLLVDLIGTGAMGAVWRGYDLRDQRWVAVKVLTGGDDGLTLRFVREQGLRIDHPHVVAPTGWAAEDETVVFTMDLIRGGSALQLLAEHGPLPEYYVAILLDQLLQALAAVHDQGVVHRDVKPANLLLEPTGAEAPHLRLGDFGVAAVEEQVRLTQAPGLVGTEGYAAPEQAEAGPDPRQDLYAAGRVMIHLLTGLGPARQTGPPEGRLLPVLAALTATNPADRPGTAPEALALLRRHHLPIWHSYQGGPVVPDRLGEASLPLGRGLGLDRDPAAHSPERRVPATVWAAAGCFAGAIGLGVAALVRILG